MSDDKRVVHAYMDAYMRFDRAAIGALLTDDVCWDVPGAFHIEGREAFDAHIIDPYSDGRTRHVARRRLRGAEDTPSGQDHHDQPGALILGSARHRGAWC